jgi:ribosomal protein S18 acetylase RimI-like enzyme
MLDYEIREFTIEYYDEAFSLWKDLEGISLSEADSFDGIQSYLVRNPGLSFIALQDEKLIGTILCGHDGRRGYIHHLAVSKEFQKMGIGRSLAKKSLSAIKTIGIQKCHLFVVSDNFHAQKFWEQTGWLKREDIIIMSYNL